MGAGWCPPGILGVGIGGTPEKAMLLAKESIMAPVDIHELKAKAAEYAKTGAKLTRPEELRLELMEKINALGVGAPQPSRGRLLMHRQESMRGSAAPGRSAAAGRGEFELAGGVGFHGSSLRAGGKYR